MIAAANVNGHLTVYVSGHRSVARRYCARDRSRHPVNTRALWSRLIAPRTKMPWVITWGDHRSDRSNDERVLPLQRSRMTDHSITADHLTIMRPQSWTQQCPVTRANCSRVTGHLIVLLVQTNQRRRSRRQSVDTVTTERQFAGDRSTVIETRRSPCPRRWRLCRSRRSRTRVPWRRRSGYVVARRTRCYRVVC